MKNQISSRIPTIIFVLGSILLGYLILYRPISNKLENALIEKWQLSARAKAYSLQLTIQNGIEDGKSISSRSAIRDKLYEYKEGAVTWETLQEYTVDKYADGAAVLENVVFAYRMVDDQILVQYIADGQTTFFDDFQSMNLPLTDDRTFENNDKTYFLVISNILENNTILGSDIIVYDISSTLSDLNSEDYLVTIISPSEVTTPDQIASKNQLDNPDSHIVSYVEKLDDMNAFVNIHSSRARILADTAYDTDFYLIIYILFLVLLYIISTHIFVQQTHDVINEIEESKQGYMTLAYRDALTNAFTRQYFMEWRKLHKEELSSPKGNYVLVMIDIDKMKTINDTYGHESGDNVLKTVVHTIQENLRKDDMIIRFGGDEFIAIFKGISLQTTEQIMLRIKNELEQINFHPIPIHISFGIAKITQTTSIDAAIKQADINMYLVKNEKPQ